MSASVAASAAQEALSAAHEARSASADVRAARGVRSASTTRARAGHWLAWAACGVALVALAFALRRTSPVNDPAHSLCLMREATGVPCATCGFTRASALLARGAWRASLAIHPMAIVFAIQLATGWLVWAVAMARRWRRMPDRWLPHALAINAAALVALWIARLATGTLPG